MIAIHMLLYITCIQQPEYIHTTEYYFTLKRNKLLIHTTTRMVLNLLSRSQKITYYMTPFIGHSQWQNYRGRKQISGCLRLRMVGRGRWHVWLYKGVAQRRSLWWWNRSASWLWWWLQKYTHIINWHRHIHSYFTNVKFLALMLYYK